MVCPPPRVDFYVGVVPNCRGFVYTSALADKNKQLAALLVEEDDDDDDGIFSKKTAPSSGGRSAKVSSLDLDDLFDQSEASA